MTNQDDGAFEEECFGKCSDESVEECLQEECLEKESLKDDSLKIKPPLKWAGGKSKILDDLKKKFPKKCERYFEPFVGAGSMALNVDYPKIIINDSNETLIAFWKFLQKDGAKFIDECEKLFIPENNSKEVFYALRKEFNTTDDVFRKATLLLYLNRHCYNGLCRYNSSGEFNVPIGSYKEPYFPRKELKNCLSKVQYFEIHNIDFREILDMAKEGDLVYCDPPYMPLSDTANFNSYSKNGFPLKNQLDLAKCAASAAERGATVVVSNHYNWYSKQLYSDMFGAKTSKLQVSRTISSKTTKRNSVEEIVAVFSKKNSLSKGGQSDK